MSLITDIQQKETCKEDLTVELLEKSPNCSLAASLVEPESFAAEQQLQPVLISCASKHSTGFGSHHCPDYGGTNALGKIEELLRFNPLFRKLSV
ncbi:hypothetical protein BaRGS_00006392 [Batillaria attramentaria]|uniref:Uncharacterized protein n=1 Tax=Batillaria attramentaria TaxID=370345 RepID=A0ABD0LSB6_9CAEN